MIAAVQNARTAADAAQAEVERLRDAARKASVRLGELETRENETQAAQYERALVEALGDVPSTPDLSAALADLRAKRAEAEHVAERIDAMVEDAEKAQESREAEHAEAVRSLASTVEPNARARAEAAWRAAADAHAAWTSIAEAANARCTGGYARSFGETDADGHAPDRVSEMIWAAGLDPETLTRRGGFRSPATLAALTALASDDQ